MVLMEIVGITAAASLFPKAIAPVLGRSGFGSTYKQPVAVIDTIPAFCSHRNLFHKNKTG